MISAKARPCAEGTIRSITAEPDVAKTAKFWVLLTAILGSTTAFIDESVVNVALPAIEQNLHVPVTVIQWLVNAYTLCLAALILIGGAAGDRFGRRRMFVIGTVIFAVASAWCGVAPDTFQLLAARAVQGIGAALLIPCSLALIGAAFDEAERGRAIGTWAGFSAISAAIGPPLGGWIVDHMTWRAIFLINPLIAIPIVWIALRHLPESRDPDASADLDWPGALLAFVGLGALVFGLMTIPGLGWRDPAAIVPLVAGLLLLAAFIWVETYSRAPMVPLELFRSRTFSGVNLLTLFLYAALGGALFFVPFALIQVHGYSATVAGSVFLPFTLVMAALSRISGGLLDRFGARLPLVVGPVVVAFGFWLLAAPRLGDAFWSMFLLPMAVLGLGMAISVAPLTTLVINAVETRRAGIASGINNAVASLAALLAVAVFGAVGLHLFNGDLDSLALGANASPAVREAIEQTRDHFVTTISAGNLAIDERQIAEKILRQSLGDAIRVVMLMAAALALAASATAAVTLGSERRH